MPRHIEARVSFFFGAAGALDFSLQSMALVYAPQHFFSEKLNFLLLNIVYAPQLFFSRKKRRLSFSCYLGVSFLERTLVQKGLKGTPNGPDVGVLVFGVGAPWGPR